MDRSKFIASLAGPVALALGVSVFINRDIFPDLIARIQNDPALIMVAGIVALTAGLAIVKMHNIWTGWPALVTAIGWLLIIGGVARIILPRQMAEMATSLIPGPAFFIVPAVLLCLAGAFMTYKGNT